MTNTKIAFHYKVNSSKLNYPDRYAYQRKLVIQRLRLTHNISESIEHKLRHGFEGSDFSDGRFTLQIAFYI